MLVDDFLAAAARAADAAAAAIAGQQKVGAVHRKPDGSPSIMADALAEQAAVEQLLPLGIKIISEEGFGDGAEPAQGEPWVALDPIDGTGNFRAGLPPYATSVGLVVDGVAVAGLVHEHASGRRWQGAEGRGATRNGHAITPRAAGTLLVPSPDDVAVLLPGFHRLRISGCTAADLCAVADGAAAAWQNLDRSGTHTHDVAGGLAVAAAAGCAIATPDGRPLRLPTDTRAKIRFVLAADDERARTVLAAETSRRAHVEIGGATST